VSVIFKQATPADAEVICRLVMRLTAEICQLTNTQHFDINSEQTTQRCRALLADGLYAAIIAFDGEQPVGLATLAETYALYAGGKVGIIQEFYVEPEQRSTGLGAQLIEQVREYGRTEAWACIELCTPPLPEFERTVNFYQNNGLQPVGGRKMRQALDIISPDA